MVAMVPPLTPPTAQRKTEDAYLQPEPKEAPEPKPAPAPQEPPEPVPYRIQPAVLMTPEEAARSRAESWIGAASLPEGPSRPQGQEAAADSGSVVDLRLRRRVPAVKVPAHGIAADQASQG